MMFKKSLLSQSALQRTYVSSLMTIVLWGLIAWAVALP